MTLPCILKAITKVLLLILLAVFPKMVTLFQANLEAQEDILNQQQQTIGNATTS
jgi:hypothetical protein